MTERNRSSHDRGKGGEIESRPTKRKGKREASHSNAFDVDFNIYAGLTGQEIDNVNKVDNNVQPVDIRVRKRTGNTDTTSSIDSLSKVKAMVANRMGIRPGKKARAKDKAQGSIESQQQQEKSQSASIANAQLDDVHNSGCRLVCGHAHPTGGDSKLSEGMGTNGDAINAPRLVTIRTKAEDSGSVGDIHDANCAITTGQDRYSKYAKVGNAPSSWSTGDGGGGDGGAGGDGGGGAGGDGDGTGGGGRGGGGSNLCMTRKKGDSERKSYQDRGNGTDGRGTDMQDPEFVKGSLVLCSSNLMRAPEEKKLKEIQPAAREVCRRVVEKGKEKTGGVMGVYQNGAERWQSPAYLCVKEVEDGEGGDDDKFDRSPNGDESLAVCGSNPSPFTTTSITDDEMICDLASDTPDSKRGKIDDINDLRRGNTKSLRQVKFATSRAIYGDDAEREMDNAKGGDDTACDFVKLCELIQSAYQPQTKEYFYFCRVIQEDEIYGGSHFSVNGDGHDEQVVNGSVNPCDHRYNEQYHDYGRCAINVKGNRNVQPSHIREPQQRERNWHRHHQPVVPSLLPSTVAASITQPNPAVIFAHGSHLRKPRYTAGTNLRFLDLDDRVHGVGMAMEWRATVLLMEVVDGKCRYWLRVHGSGEKGKTNGREVIKETGHGVSCEAKGSGRGDRADIDPVKRRLVLKKAENGMSQDKDDEGSIEGPSANDYGGDQQLTTRVSDSITSYSDAENAKRAVKASYRASEQERQHQAGMRSSPIAASVAAATIRPAIKSTATATLTNPDQDNDLIIDVDEARLVTMVTVAAEARAESRKNRKARMVIEARKQQQQQQQQEEEEEEEEENKGKKDQKSERESAGMIYCFSKDDTNDNRRGEEVQREG